MSKFDSRRILPSTLASHIRLNTKDLLDSLASGREVPVLRAGDPPLTIVLQPHIQGVLAVQLGKLGLDMIKDELVHVGTLHVWNSANGKFTNDLGGNDRLGTWGRVSTFDAVDRQRGVSPSGHESALLGRVDASLTAQ